MEHEASIRQSAEEVARRQGAIVEAACEQALQLGDRGVLVCRRGSILLSADPDESVPYGTIHVRDEGLG